MNGITLDSKLSTALYAHVCYFFAVGAVGVCLGLFKNACSVLSKEDKV